MTVSAPSSSSAPAERDSLKPMSYRIRSSMEPRLTMLMTRTLSSAPSGGPGRSAAPASPGSRACPVDHHRPALEIEPHASGVGGEKDPAVVIFPEPLHETLPPLRRDLAVQVDEADSVSSSTSSTSPVIRSHWLNTTTFSPPSNQLVRIVSSSSTLGPCSGLLVHQLGVVRRHPHGGQRDLHPFLVRLAEKPLPPPLEQQLPHRLAIFLVDPRCSGVRATRRVLSTRSGNLLETSLFFLRIMTAA